MQYFVPDLLPWSNDYIISIAASVYEKIGSTSGSFNVLFARLLGLSYADALRYMQDYYGAKVTGKEGFYCSIHFNSKQDCERICKLLSSRWAQLLRRL